jgi:hypothetical protein
LTKAARKGGQKKRKRVKMSSAQVKKVEEREREVVAATGRDRKR